MDNDTLTIENLLALQYQITEALQKKVLSTMDSNDYKWHFDSLDASFRLIERLGFMVRDEKNEIPESCSNMTMARH